ncbi:MAG: hypothetical protein ACREF4_19360 [Gammaproteobacteria bacterium]
MIGTDKLRAFVEAELTGDKGQALVWQDWWTEAARGLREAQQTVVVSPRQNGKSTYAAAEAASLLFHEPDVFCLYVANSEVQARSVLRQKLVRALERNPRLARDARITERRIEVPALHSALEVVPASEATAPGRTVDLLVIDEARDCPDELYWRLFPSTLAGGKVLIVSSPGPPRGFLFELTQNPGERVRVVSLHDLSNPFVNQEHVEAAAHFAHLWPGLHAREYRGEFADLGDEFIGRDRLDACVDPALENRATARGAVYAFLDLSRRRDLTSLVAVERTSDPDLITVIRIETIDPRRCQGGEVDFGAVRLFLVELFSSFRVRVLGVDDRAEAGELLAWCRRQRWGGAVRPMAATAQSNMDQWGRLAERIGAGTIRLPAHRRLLDELLSLRVEDMAGGRAWRVVDTRRRFHRDVSMALAGAVWLATEKPAEGDGMKVGILTDEEEDDADEDSVVSILNEQF